MKSPAPFIALSLAILVSACGGSDNTTGKTTGNTNSSNASAPSNTSNSANTANTSNTSNTSTSQSSGSHPTDQIDTAAKVEKGKTMTLKEDVTITIPADWKKTNNEYVDEFVGKTKDGKELSLIVYWSPAGDEYKGLSTPEAALKRLKKSREDAENNAGRYSLARVLRLGDHPGVAYDTLSSTPDGAETWTWITWDSADFEKGFAFKYPAGTFDQHKSLRDGIINSVKFKRGPRMPSM